MPVSVYRTTIKEIYGIYISNDTCPCSAVYVDEDELKELVSKAKIILNEIESERFKTECEKL